MHHGNRESQSTGNLEIKITYMHFGFEEFYKFVVSKVKVSISDVMCMDLFIFVMHEFRSEMYHT